MDTSPDRILQWAVWAFVLLFSVIVHENAHGIAANRFGDATAKDAGRITMNPIPHIDPIGTLVVPILLMVSGAPLIGWAKPVPVNPANLRNPIVHNAYVAAAGPLSNFLLAVASAAMFIVVGLVFKHVPGLRQTGSHSFLFFQLLFIGLIQINCVLGLFNLIPIPPLDGHWILFRYLPPRWAEGLAVIRPYGLLVLVALLWTGVLGRVLVVPMELISSGLFGLVRAAVNHF